MSSSLLPDVTAAESFAKAARKTRELIGNTEGNVIQELTKTHAFEKAIIIRNRGRGMLQGCVMKERACEGSVPGAEELRQYGCIYLRKEGKRVIVQYTEPCTRCHRKTCQGSLGYGCFECRRLHLKCNKSWKTRTSIFSKDNVNQVALKMTGMSDPNLKPIACPRASVDKVSDSDSDMDIIASSIRENNAEGRNRYEDESDPYEDEGRDEENRKGEDRNEEEDRDKETSGKREEVSDPDGTKALQDLVQCEITRLRIEIPTTEQKLQIMKETLVKLEASKRWIINKAC